MEWEGNIMRFRVLVILSLILLSSLVLTGLPASHSSSSTPLVFLSPPAGLELPVGQGVLIGVQNRLPGTERVDLEFRANGLLLQTGGVMPGESAVASWIPAQAGPHVLTVVARAGDRQVARITRRLLVMPAGSPVRILQAVHR